MISGVCYSSIDRRLKNFSVRKTETGKSKMKVVLFVLITFITCLLCTCTANVSQGSPSDEECLHVCPAVDSCPQSKFTRVKVTERGVTCNCLGCEPPPTQSWWDKLFGKR
ncbi:uncharacterized protein [Acropora muricata]|uniref:uncharacterized protein n=1 Tax=Acropora muricata TaxID=159855 RepID=UPI0034E42061